MKRRLLELLEREVLLCDGAMGTLLASLGVPLNGRDELNLSNPALVKKVHRDYIQAGARIIETNTFTANRIKLKQYGLLDKIEDINRAAVRIAKEAVGDEEVFVAGSVGPLGALVKPYGNLTIEELGEIYTEQMHFLVEEGIDAILIETHPSLLETLEALNAARSVSDLPVICSMTFLADGRTTFGDELVVSLEALASAGADVVGINCTLGPQETYDLIDGLLEKSDLRLLVMPNAGYPMTVGSRATFLSSPDYLKKYARLYLEAGASIIGGCCGTTPEHIRSMSEVLRGQSPRRRRLAVAVLEPPEEKHAERLAWRFSEKLGREQVITVEVDPPQGLDSSPVIEAARAMKAIGVDAIAIAESPLTRTRLWPTALAHLIQQEAGIETILRFTCRERNVAAVQSELLGAAALGIKNVIALASDPAVVGDFPRVASVHDLSAAGLVRIIRGLNQGKDLAGTDLGRPTGFKIGISVNPAADDLGREIAKLKEKVEAGADFAETQPLYDIALLERFLERAAAEGLEIPVLVGLLPLRSLKHAEFLNNEVPGITIPEELLERLRRFQEREAQAREGIEIARELLEQACKLAAGVVILPPFDRYDTVSEILKGRATASALTGS